MSQDDTSALKQEVAALRDENLRLKQNGSQGIDHPDFQGFREMSRALNEGRYHEWYTDKHMFPGAYGVIKVVVITGFVLAIAFFMYMFLKPDVKPWDPNWCKGSVLTC